MLIDHRGHLDTTGRAARLDHVIQAAITEAMCLNKEGHLPRHPAREENPQDFRNGITQHGYSAKSKGIHIGFLQYRRQRSLVAAGYCRRFSELSTVSVLLIPFFILFLLLCLGPVYSPSLSHPGVGHSLLSYDHSLLKGGTE